MNTEELRKQIRLLFKDNFVAAGTPKFRVLEDQLVELITARDAEIKKVAQEMHKSLCGCPMCEHHTYAYRSQLNKENN